MKKEELLSFGLSLIFLETFSYFSMEGLIKRNLNLPKHYSVLRSSFSSVNNLYIALLILNY